MHAHVQWLYPLPQMVFSTSTKFKSNECKSVIVKIYHSDMARCTRQSTALAPALISSRREIYTTINVSTLAHGRFQFDRQKHEEHQSVNEGNDARLLFKSSILALSWPCSPPRCCQRQQSFKTKKFQASAVDIVSSDLSIQNEIECGTRTIEFDE